MLVHEYHKAGSVVGPHQSLQQVWFKTCSGHGVKQNHSGVTPYGQTLTRVPWRRVSSAQVQPALCSDGRGPQLGPIGLEEEGFFLLAGHGTQKFHLIDAEKRESGGGRSDMR